MFRIVRSLVAYLFGITRRQKAELESHFRIIAETRLQIERLGDTWVAYQPEIACDPLACADAHYSEELRLALDRLEQYLGEVENSTFADPRRLEQAFSRICFIERECARLTAVLHSRHRPLAIERRAHPSRRVSNWRRFMRTAAAACV
jgi:hypothetical protein